MVDAWGGWSLFQSLLQTLKQVASKHGVSIPVVAVKYILEQVMKFTLLCMQKAYVVKFSHSTGDNSCDRFCLSFLFVKLQPAVAGSMIGVRLGLAEHIQDSNAVFSLSLDEEDVNSIQEVSRKGKDLLRIIGDCGDEYRRA